MRMLSIMGIMMMACNVGLNGEVALRRQNALIRNQSRSSKVKREIHRERENQKVKDRAKKWCVCEV